MSVIEADSKKNFESLCANIYPGRGIIQGMTPDGKNMVQIYWIMGRSENSRNRIFIEENGFVRTHPHDPAKMKDPSLIIYYPIRFYKSSHIVSNGDQTDTVYNALHYGGNFSDSLKTREFEPDAPNYTPRITGLIDTSSETAYRFSVIRSSYNDPSRCERFSYEYEKAMPGYGHCVHTYHSDGNPLPSFSSSPYIVPLTNNIEENLKNYATGLNQENLVSLLVKYIDIKNSETAIRLYNVHK